MKYLELVAELEEIASQLNLKIRYEKGNFEGGFCILKEERLLVVNRKLPDPKRASTLARALSEYGIENVFLKPNVRQYIEDEMVRQRGKTSRRSVK